MNNSQLPNSIQNDIQILLSKAIKSQFNLDINPVEINIEYPKDRAHGDFSTNIAMQLARELKLPPMEIAKGICDKFHGKIENLGKERSFGVIQIDAIPANPGFINFKISDSLILEKVKSIKFNLDILANQKIILEFTDPNPFKEFHIGHLYSNSVGESLSRLHEAMGATVKRADFFGDVGMHVSKSIWGLMKKMKEDSITLDDLDKKPLKQRIEYLGQSYAKGATAYKDDEDAKEEMKDINYVVFWAGQQYLIQHHNWTPMVDYEKYILGKDVDREKITEIYFRGKKWSLDYFEEIYARVGTKFDYYYPESFVGEYGMQTVNEGLEKGVFEISDGAVIFDGEKHGLHKRVFRNSLGLPTYEAKDLGLAPSKYRDFAYDKSIIITANEINEYFKVVLKALSLIHPELAEKTTHIGHGVVKLPEGKMSSRTGKIITGESLIESAKAKALEIIRESGKIESEDEDNIAETIAIGGIKYAFLRSAIGGDIVFSFEESISFEGNSGPYLQYTYARCKSIMRNSELSEIVDTFGLDILEDSERSLMLSLTKFETAIFDSATNLSPHIMCNYLFDLAQEFNSFYQKCKVVGSEYESRRIFLTSQTASVLQKGLEILGIKTVERM